MFQHNFYHVVCSNKHKIYFLLLVNTYTMLITRRKVRDNKIIFKECLQEL